MNVQNDIMDAESLGFQELNLSAFDEIEQNLED